MTRVQVRRFLVGLMGLAGTAAAQPVPLEAVRVALPAQVVHAGRPATLLPRQRVDVGDTVATGARGRAAVQLAGVGQVTLGANSEVYVHSAEPPEAGRGALARLALLRGVVRVDTRSKHGLPPQDFRLNAGRLAMRIFGAEVWVELSGRGEDVCLLSGAVEIVVAGSQERLDTEGSCLLFGTTGLRLKVRPDASETLARKLVRTAFAEDYVTRMTAEAEGAFEEETSTSPDDTDLPETPRAEGFMTTALEEATAKPQAVDPVRTAVVASTPPPAPIPRLKPARAVPPVPDPLPEPIVAAAPQPVPATPTPVTGAWTVVVASVASAAAAEREAARLRQAGLIAEVVPAVRDGGMTYRVTLGALSTREEARSLAAKVKTEHQLTGAWVTQR